jgi:hypothetical protein
MRGGMVVGVVMGVESRCEEVWARGLWCVFGVG